jgi:hypothetical protein
MRRENPMTTAAERATRRSAASRARKTAAGSDQAVTPAPTSLAEELETIDAEETAAAPAGVESADAIAERLTAAARATNTGKKFRSDTSLALPIPDLTQLDSNDVVYPKLRPSQQMSEVNRDFTKSRGKGGVAAGNWYLSTEGKDLGEVVYFVPVSMRKSRALFLQGKGLICRSFDMLRGEGDPGGFCEGTLEEIHELPAEERGCPLRLWERNGDKSTPPKCGISYNFAGFLIHDIDNPDTSKLSPCLLQLRSTATGAAKAINTFVTNQGGGVWHNVIVELGLNERTNAMGTFYVPTVDLFETIDTDTDTSGDFRRILKQGAVLSRTADAATMRRSAEASED